MHATLPASIPSPSFETAPSRLTIDLGALVANWQELNKRSGPARTAAVVKADAYGLGATPVAKALFAAGCRDYFVATPDEGAILRESVGDARIVVLSGAWPGTEWQFSSARLIPAIASLEQLAFWQTTFHEAPYALYVDTGMNRLGVTPEEAIALAGQGARPALVMSHLACSDQPDHAMNRQQLESFQGVVRHFPGIESSLSSSAGIFLGPDYHFDLTRPGISLYGGAAIGGTAGPMRPVAKAEARLLQIRPVKAGDAVSYGATHRFAADGLVGIAAIGYADGWQRAISGAGVAMRRDGSPGGQAEIGGHLVPVVGRVTMDLTMFDLTAIGNQGIKAGDYLTLFGGRISLDETARAAGTIGYEILTALGRRYARAYI